MKRSEFARWAAIALNALNVILAAAAISAYFTGMGDGNMAVAGVRCFRFFTNDSNILSALASLVILPFLWKKRVPMWAAVLKYVGAVSVTVTLLTVVLFLGPTQGYGRMFVGVCLYLHLICPLLSIASVYLPESDRPLPQHAWLFGMLTVAVYGAVYIAMVLITRRWPDFYGFARGGYWYISLPAMLIFGALLSLLMAFLQRKAVAHRRRAKA